MTELEKMLAGEMHDITDPEVVGNQTYLKNF